MSRSPYNCDFMGGWLVMGRPESKSFRASFSVGTVTSGGKLMLKQTNALAQVDLVYLSAMSTIKICKGCVLKGGEYEIKLTRLECDWIAAGLFYMSPMYTTRTVCYLITFLSLPLNQSISFSAEQVVYMAAGYSVAFVSCLYAA